MRSGTTSATAVGALVEAALRRALAEAQAEQLSKRDPEVVVLDLTLPVLSGRDVFREIRRRQADIPILLSSGCNE